MKYGRNMVKILKVKTKKKKASKRIEERERINLGWEKKALILMRTESTLEALQDKNLDLFLNCLCSVAQLNELLMLFYVM
jgi:hypothetical protein